MKTSILSILLFFTAVICFSQESKPQKNELSAYVSFLEKQNVSAKDYVLDLFKKFDIFILCERNHNDVVQYDLITDIIKDDRFTKTVGNVYFEVGTSSLNPRLNDFLHKPDLTDEQVKKEVMDLHRNSTPFLLWEKYNLTYFLTRLYSINKNSKNKVDVYPVDMPFDWASANEETLRAVYNQMNNRDSIMASQIISIYNTKLKESGKSKGLVIMNFRHAFNRHTTRTQNVGKYLFDQFPGKVANVYINNFKGGDGKDFVLIQNGKWDAAFKKASKDNIGFNFSNSPFGKDSVDISKFATKITYSDLFNGFVYYRPATEWKLVTGIDGIIDDNFSSEFLRRVELFNKVFKKNNPANIEALKLKFNTQTEKPIPNMQEIQTTIDKWLE